MKRTFEMNGKSYTSMMEIARELGVKRIYPRDFDKYGIVETTGTVTDAPVVDGTQKSSEVKTEKVAEKQAAGSKEEPKTTTKTDKPKKNNKKTAEKAETTKKAPKKEEQPKDKKEDKQPKVDRRFTRKVGTPEQIKEVQDKAGQMTIVEFSNFIKHFSLDALVQLAEDAGVNTWESISNEPIRKMRLLMEIKGHYFPNDKTPVKPSSCWKKVSLEKLLELADEKKLEYKKSSDEKIQRMWVILALNNAKLTLQDLKQEKQGDDADAQS